MTHLGTEKESASGAGGVIIRRHCDSCSMLISKNTRAKEDDAKYPFILARTDVELYGVGLGGLR